jgi:anoctamin-10
MVPLIIGQLSGVATKLTDFENYENESSYEAAMTQKIFVFNFICSYVPLFLTAFIYVPFGNVIVPHIDIFNLLPQSSSETHPVFQINPGRLRKQMIQFTVTAQVVNLAMETVVPHFKRSAFKKAKEIRARHNGQEQVYVNDSPEEKEFLTRVRNEVELDTYNVTDDLREMCMQFGYLCLFAPIWPLAAVSFVINNWVELRSDAAKICVEMRRPVPDRADSIGPWLQSLGFLTWLGSVTTAALVYLFSAPAAGQQAPTVWTLAGILGSIVFSEHIYFLARMVVRVALSNMDSPGLTKERQERFMARRRFLQESLGVDEETEMKIMEGDAFTGEEGGAKFWSTQKGPQGAIEAGLKIMSEGKKEQ